MLKSVLPLTFGLALAGGLSQFPEFAQQYTQRVGGAYVELRAVADDFRADANTAGKTVAQAIDQYQAADSAFFKDRGDSMAKVMTREAYLRQHYTDLTSGNAFDRLLAFASARDNDIAADTLQIYQPALPLTVTGFSHAGLGFFGGYILLRFPFLFRRRRKASLV